MPHFSNYSASDRINDSKLQKTPRPGACGINQQRTTLLESNNLACDTHSFEAAVLSVPVASSSY